MTNICVCQEDRGSSGALWTNKILATALSIMDIFENLFNLIFKETG